MPGLRWARGFTRSVAALTRSNLKLASRAALRANPRVDARKAPRGAGDWLPGLALGVAGARRFHLYRPPGIALGERLPLLVMLHGCGQDAKSFALSTRMNSIAARERFFVLYPEQDRLANLQGCWNWFDTQRGHAHGEATLIMNAIDQACLLYAVDGSRIAVAGLSAGASMAALLVTRHPERFNAVVMHSGIPPGTAHSTLSALGAMRGRRTTKHAAATLDPPWPPLLVIHGGADRVVAARNGQAAAQLWANAAGAQADAPRSVQRGKRYPMQVTDFKRRSETVATLVEVAQLGHAWSGGAARHAFCDVQGPDASRMVWAFVAKQFRARHS